MKIELEKSELELMKIAINSSDPFTTVKDAERRVYTTKQRIRDLKLQLKVDEETLEKLKSRDKMIEKLKDKLNG